MDLERTPEAQREFELVTWRVRRYEPDVTVVASEHDMLRKGPWKPGGSREQL